MAARRLLRRVFLGSSASAKSRFRVCSSIGFRLATANSFVCVSSEFALFCAPQKLCDVSSLRSELAFVCRLLLVACLFVCPKLRRAKAKPKAKVSCTKRARLQNSNALLLVAQKARAFRAHQTQRKLTCFCFVGVFHFSLVCTAGCVTFALLSSRPKGLICCATKAQN